MTRGHNNKAVERGSSLIERSPFCEHSCYGIDGGKAIVRERIGRIVPIVAEIEANGVA